jgi:hypothetical protein
MSMYLLFRDDDMGPNTIDNSFLLCNGDETVSILSYFL